MKYPRNRKLLDFHTAENAFICHVAVEEPLEVDGDREPVLDVPIPRDVETADVEAFAIRLMHVADDLRPATVMLSLCTSHMPEPHPYWGEDLRVIATADRSGGAVGFIVAYMPFDDEAEMEGYVPEWLWPAWKEAKACGARLIEFDRDNNVYDHLPKWEW